MRFTSSSEGGAVQRAYRALLTFMTGLRAHFAKKHGDSAVSAVYQMDLPINFPKEAYEYGRRSSAETHGVVLTKPHLVELILDLAGCTSDRDLAQMRLLEPECGHGAFLVPAVGRLMAAAKAARVRAEKLADCVRAFDIDDAHVEITRSAVIETLRMHGVDANTASVPAEKWIQVGDFLLTSVRATFDAVVGTPPCIRIEQIAPALQANTARAIGLSTTAPTCTSRFSSVG